MSELDDKIANCQAELTKAKNVLEAKPESEYFQERKKELEAELKGLQKQKKVEESSS